MGTSAPTVEICACCGAGALVAHLLVAGEPGDAGLIPTTDRYGVALADIVRCGACGHMQLERFPAELDLAASYAAAESLDYVDEEAGQRATARANLEAIERHVPRGSILDLGCWVGFLLAEARSRGWRTLGVEPSAFASAYARDELRLEVLTENLFAARLEEGVFDAVFLGDVIEHIPDPARALSRIRELLAPAGVVALALPDAGSRLARAMGARWWSVLPTHVHYFTSHSIALLLDRQGFEVLEITTAPKTFSIGYYLGRIGGYRRGLADRLVAAAERIGIAERPWTPDFGDRMLVVARRR